MSEENTNRTLFLPNKTYEVLKRWRHIAIFAYGYLLPMALGYLLQFIFASMNVEQYLNVLLSNILTNFFIILGVVLFLVFFVKGYFSRLFNKENPYALYIAYIVVLIVSMYILNFIWSLSSQAIASAVGLNLTSNANQSLIVEMNRLYPFGVFVLTVLLAPIAEEFTYRLGLSDIFYRNKPIVGAIISAFLFALAHFNFNALILDKSDMEASLNLLYIELLNLPSYFISGIVLSLAYKSTGSLISSYAIHLVNNLIAWAALMIPTAPLDSTSSLAGLLIISNFLGV